MEFARPPPAVSWLDHILQPHLLGPLKPRLNVMVALRNLSLLLSPVVFNLFWLTPLQGESPDRTGFWPLIIICAPYYFCVYMSFGLRFMVFFTEQTKTAHFVLFWIPYSIAVTVLLWSALQMRPDGWELQVGTLVSLSLSVTVGNVLGGLGWLMYAWKVKKVFPYSKLSMMHYGTARSQLDIERSDIQDVGSHLLAPENTWRGPHGLPRRIPTREELLFENPLTARDFHVMNSRGKSLVPRNSVLLTNEERAVIIIQKYVRGFLERRAHGATLHAVISKRNSAKAMAKAMGWDDDDKPQQQQQQQQPWQQQGQRQQEQHLQQEQDAWGYEHLGQYEMEHDDPYEQHPPGQPARGESAEYEYEYEDVDAVDDDAVFDDTEAWLHGDDGGGVASAHRVRAADRRHAATGPSTGGGAWAEKGGAAAAASFAPASAAAGDAAAPPQMSIIDVARRGLKKERDGRVAKAVAMKAGMGLYSCDTLRNFARALVVLMFPMLSFIWSQGYVVLFNAFATESDVLQVVFFVMLFVSFGLLHSLAERANKVVERRWGVGVATDTYSVVLGYMVEIDMMLIYRSLFTDVSSWTVFLLAEVLEEVAQISITLAPLLFYKGFRRAALFVKRVFCVHEVVDGGHGGFVTLSMRQKNLFCIHYCLKNVAALVSLASFAVSINVFRFGPNAANVPFFGYERIDEAGFTLLMQFVIVGFVIEGVGMVLVRTIVYKAWGMHVDLIAFRYFERVMLATMTLFIMGLTAMITANVALYKVNIDTFNHHLRNDTLAAELNNSTAVFIR